MAAQEQQAAPIADALDFDRMSDRKLRAWIDANPGHEDLDDARDVLLDREDQRRAERREDAEMGLHDDSPSLPDPWWASP